MLLCCKVISQIEINATKVSLSNDKSALLRQQVSKYQAFSIGNTEWTESLINNKEGILKLQIDSIYNWMINLRLNDLRSPYYKAIYTTEKDTIVYPELEINTFKGETFDGRITRFTITKDYLMGVILDGQKYYTIRPLSDYTKNKNDKELIIYESSDIISQEYFKNDFEETIENAITQQKQIASVRGISNDIEPCSYYLEIATDADYEYFMNAGGGNVINTYQNILSVLNIVEGVYESIFGIKFLVTFQNVYTTISNPYSTTDASALLNQFKDYWNSNRTDVIRDVAHLFTGQTLNNNIVGIAKLGHIGDNQSYSLSMNRLQMFTTTAHELGHNFNANHPSSATCECGTPLASVMCQGTKDSNLWFCDVSINEIAHFFMSKFSILSNISNDLTLSGTKNGYNAYTALNNIQSTQTINSGMTEYAAGNQIVLTPGFHAQAGSIFNAKIDTPEPCEPITVSGISGNVCIGTGIEYTVFNAKYYSFKVYSMGGATIFSRSGLVQGTTISPWLAIGVPTGYYIVEISFYSPNDEYTNTYTVLVHSCSSRAPASTEIASEIIKVKQNFNIKITPNPFYESITVDFVCKELSDVSLLICDMAGRIVSRPYRNEKLTDGNHNLEIQTTMFDKGAYLIHITINETTYTRKVIKK